MVNTAMLFYTIDSIRKGGFILDNDNRFDMEKLRYAIAIQYVRHNLGAKTADQMIEELVATLGYSKDEAIHAILNA